MKSAPLPVKFYLTPSVREMGWFASNTAENAKFNSATNIANITFNHIYNHVAALGSKADAHHEHSIWTLVLLIFILTVLLVVFAVKFFKRRFEAAVERKAAIGAIELA